MSERWCNTCGKPLSTSSATATECQSCENWWRENPPSGRTVKPTTAGPEPANPGATVLAELPSIEDAMTTQDELAPPSTKGNPMTEKQATLADEIVMLDVEYSATGPNYDASYEGPEDGWVDNGERVFARTLDDLRAEVDAYIEDKAASAPTSNGGQ